MLISRSTLLPAIAVAALAAPTPGSSTGPGSQGSSNGLSECSKSAGGGSVCCTGLIPVSVTATNMRLNVEEPANQTVLTEITQELFQENGTLATTANGGNQTITGTFNIESTFCLPPHSTAEHPPKTVQLLTHGVSLSRTYWDIAPGYSYVDAAVSAGYAVLFYNRLGVGNSDHPDPIQVVQSGVETEIAHGLTQILRQGSCGLPAFENVVGVGHSYGSVIHFGQSVEYPSDLSAVVLTGLTNVLEGAAFTGAAIQPAIAALNDPARFGELPFGYLVDDTAIAVQLAFFRFPYFDQAIFDSQYQGKETYTIGQLFSLATALLSASSYTGPVDIVLGQHDIPGCFGECDVPVDKAARTLAALYPTAGSGSEHFIVPNSGHNINDHYEAPTEFAQIIAFVQANGF